MTARTTRINAGHQVSRVAASCPGKAIPATFRAPFQSTIKPLETSTSANLGHMWLSGYGRENRQDQVLTEAVTT